MSDTNALPYHCEIIHKKIHKFYRNESVSLLQKFYVENYVDKNDNACFVKLTLPDLTEPNQTNTTSLVHLPYDGNSRGQLKLQVNRFNLKKRECRIRIGF